jgi:hypothetical protein
MSNGLDHASDCSKILWQGLGCPQAYPNSLPSAFGGAKKTFEITYRLPDLCAEMMAKASWQPLSWRVSFEWTHIHLIEQSFTTQKYTL